MKFRHARTLTLAGGLLAASLGLALPPVALAAGPTALASNQFTVDGTPNIRIGMRRAQVAAHIRPVGNMRSQGFTAAESYACDTYNSRDGRVSVMIENGVVTSMVTSDSAFRTPSGVGVGTSLQALRAAYGRQLTRKPNPYNEDFDYFVRSPSGNSLKFGMERGRVSVMTAGNRQAVEYVEGCL